MLMRSYGYEVGGFATFINWIGRLGPTVGVEFHKAGVVTHRYELDGVPASERAECVAQIGRAEAHSAGPWTPTKPSNASVGTFYKERLEPRFPLWRVESSGICEPVNSLARNARRERGTRRAVLFR